MDVEDPTGGRVGGFRIGALLARGAMGAVYLAEDHEGNLVALKLLSPELAHDERFRRRFLRESQLAATLDHPQIVRTTAAGDDSGVLYLAMDYIDGIDLRGLLRRERRLEPERAVRIVGQAAAALDAAHAAGLVHRDVKPGNVLVTEGADGDQAYVCDFGLARHVSSIGSLTGDRGFVGTIDYVAPEQIRGAPVDGRADVYALGCVLFECLTGERPFERDNELAVVYAHLNDPPPKVTERRRELPPALDAVIERALAKDPADRFGTCAALAAAAHDALAGRASPSRRPSVLLGVAAILLAAAGAVLVGLALFNHGSPKETPAPARLLAALDAGTGRSLAAAGSASRGGYGFAPSDIAFAGGSVWLLLPTEQRLLRVDLRTRRVIGSVPLPWAPLDRLAAAGGYVWVPQNGGPEVAQISATTGRLVARIQPGSSPTTGIAAGGGSVWVAVGDRIATVVPANGGIGYRIPYAGDGRITDADGALWSVDGDSEVTKLDPLTGRVLARAHLPGASDIADLAVGGGTVWVSVVPDGVVYALAERNLRLLRKLPAGADPERLSFADGRLWIADTAADEVSALDPRTGRSRRISVGASPAVAVDRGGILWTALVPPRAPLPPVAGAQLRISLPESYLTLDPAELHSTPDEQLQAVTCANLLGYPDAAGPSGEQLVPVLAAAMPRISNGGRTYTFRIREGFRFSPPSNEPVTAAGLARSFERAFSSKLGKFTRGHSDQPDLVGLAAFQSGKAAHIAGITASGDRLIFTLVHPDGSFPAKISLPHLCPVPPTTPYAALPPATPVPSAGPYYVASSNNGRIVLLPNPNYGGARRRPWARIVYTEDVPTSTAVALADRGAVDYTLDLDPGSILGPYRALDRRFGRASPGRQRYFPEIGTFLDAIVLNASRPLFRTASLRRAVNQALDRSDLAASFKDIPSDEIVPPSVAGFAAGTVFPLRADLGAARRLTGGRPRHAVLSFCTLFPWGDPGLAPIARMVRTDLARIGIAVSIVQTQSCPRVYDASSRRADLLLVTNFGTPVRDPASFLALALAPDGAYGSALGPGLWSTPSFRRRLATASRLRGAARTAAYVRLVRELTEAAPFAVYGTFVNGQYVAPRIGCELTNGASTLLDLLALCRHS